nr:hypothetical protein Itr_chr02CG11370 [Ipomoea trifida]
MVREPIAFLPAGIAGEEAEGVRGLGEESENVVAMERGSDLFMQFEAIEIEGEVAGFAGIEWKVNQRATLSSLLAAGGDLSCNLRISHTSLSLILRSIRNGFREDQGCQPHRRVVVCFEWGRRFERGFTRWNVMRSKIRE